MSYYSKDENSVHAPGTEGKRTKKDSFEIAMKKRDEKTRIEALKFRERSHADIDLQEHLQKEHNKYNH